MKNKEIFKEVILSMLAAVVAAVNIKTFIHSGNIMPGGFSGLSLLITRIAATKDITLSYSLLYILFNIPAVLLVYRFVGKRFTFISLVDVILSSLLTNIIPEMFITDDMLLIAIFGGIVSGISSSCVLAANACGGGTDFIAIYFAKKKQKSFWNESLVFNAALILISGFYFTWESALYSIIFQFVSTQVVKAVDNRYKKSTLFIISSKPEEVMRVVKEKFLHSVTVLDCIGGYTHEKKTVVYTICGKYETNQLIEAVLEIDPKAFINITNSQKLVGNFVEKPY